MAELMKNLSTVFIAGPKEPLVEIVKTRHSVERILHGSVIRKQRVDFSWIAVKPFPHTCFGIRINQLPVHIMISRNDQQFNCTETARSNQWFEQAVFGDDELFGRP